MGFCSSKSEETELLGQEPSPTIINNPIVASVEPKKTRTHQPSAIHSILIPSATRSIQPSATHSIQPSATHSIPIQPSATRSIQPSATHSIQPSATHSIQPSATHSIQPPAATLSIQPSINQKKSNTVDLFLVIMKVQCVDVNQTIEEEMTFTSFDTLNYLFHSIASKFGLIYNGQLKEFALYVVNQSSTIFITPQNLRDSILEYVPETDGLLMVAKIQNPGTHPHPLILLPSIMTGAYKNGFHCNYCRLSNLTPMRWHCSLCLYDMCDDCIKKSYRGIPSNLAKTVLPPNWISHSHALEDTSQIHIIPHKTPNTIPFYQDLVSQPRYFDEESIYRYTTGDYKKLNIQLACGYVDDDQLEWAKKLYGSCWAAKEQPNQHIPNMVFRKMFMSDKEFESYIPGEKFYFPSFTSTSAKQLNWDGNTWVYISLKPELSEHAADIAKYSMYPTEEEVLLNACTQFQVISKIATTNMYYLHLSFCD